MPSPERSVSTARRVDAIEAGPTGQRAAPGPLRVRVPVRSAGPRADCRRHVALPLLLAGIRRVGDYGGQPWFGTLGLDGLEHRRSGKLSAGRPSASPLALVLVAGLRCCSPTSRPAAPLAVPRALIELLIAAAREHGTTVILVTHDARVAAYADREVVVRDGKVSTLTGAKP